MICRKCAQGQMSGPTYVKDALGREALSYRCSVCGFTEQRPTADGGGYGSPYVGQSLFGGLLGWYDSEIARRQLAARREAAAEFQRQQEAYNSYCRTPEPPPMKDVTPKKQPQKQIVKDEK